MVAMSRPQVHICLLSFVVLALAEGCAQFGIHTDPEISSASSVSRMWTPPSASTLANNGIDLLETHEEKSSPDEVYDLSKLIELALKTNPQTRRAWYAAQAAAAQLGQSKAANYPTVSAESEGGYFKLPLQFPGQTLVVRNEEFLSQVKVNYDLLDFGRTRASERGAREQLIAANFSFNRAMQDLVFNVERAYYTLSAAKASVSAAEANLALSTNQSPGCRGAAQGRFGSQATNPYRRTD